MRDSDFFSRGHGWARRIASSGESIDVSSIGVTLVVDEIGKVKGSVDGVKGSVDELKDSVGEVRRVPP